MSHADEFSRRRRAFDRTDEAVHEASGHQNDRRIPGPTAPGWPWPLVQAVLPGFLLVGKAPAGPEEGDVLRPDQRSKRCTKCGVLKPIELFGRDRREPDGRSLRCRECWRACERARLQDPEARARKRAYARYWRAREKTRDAARRKAARELLRTEVLLAYGHRCACCAEAVREFLCVDHIRGGGCQHRKSLGAGGRFYNWLKRQGFPRDEFRLLCHNCNLARGFYGYCPHERHSPAMTPFRSDQR